ncbi:MAG: hypothetical protein QOK20_2358 [Acidimicrobiaceae bacterium]|nr:hypothetical protein [Acidimicrobiaceae bacterium]
MIASSPMPPLPSSAGKGFLLGTTTLLGLPCRDGLPRIPNASGATGSVLANAVMLPTPVLAGFAEHFPRYLVHQIDDEPQRGPPAPAELQARLDDNRLEVAARPPGGGCSPSSRREP